MAVSGAVDWLPDVAFVPDQAPEAVHDVAFVEDQVNVEELPLGMLVGLALKVSVGGGNTVTVTLRVIAPPAPVQLKSNVLVFASAPVDALPIVAFVPDHAPEAVQDVALVEDQVSVAAFPTNTLVGLALKVSVGSGRTVTITFEEVLPPSPTQVICNPARTRVLSSSPRMLRYAIVPMLSAENTKRRPKRRFALARRRR